MNIKKFWLVKTVKNYFYKTFICKTKFNPLRDLQLQSKSYSNRTSCTNLSKSSLKKSLDYDV